MSNEQLKVCKQCSKPIVDTARFKFCTQACMTLWHDQKKHAKPSAIAAPSTRKCAFCHKAMSAEAGAYGTYCSELCQRKAAEDAEVEVPKTKPLKLHSGKCAKCGVAFTTKTWPVRRFCSDKCREGVGASVQRLRKVSSRRCHVEGQRPRLVVASLTASASSPTSCRSHACALPAPTRPTLPKPSRRCGDRVSGKVNINDNVVYLRTKGPTLRYDPLCRIHRKY